MNNELIMYGLLGSGLIVWIASYVYTVWYERRRIRLVDEQIKEGVVPVNYSAVVREWATKYNNQEMGFPTAKDEAQFASLQNLRTTVAMIRVEGFDVARDARENGVLFGEAIEFNPYEKGSGEAKQWARGFCQEGGHPPKGWMERA